MTINLKPNKTMNITVIKSHRNRSYHTSFKKACLAYGWDYTEAIKGGTPKVWKGYKIAKVETEVSIPDLLLQDFLLTKFEQYDEWHRDTERDYAEVTWILGEEKYVLEGSVSISSESGSNSTGNAYSDSQGGGDWYEWDYDNIEINSIIDVNGEEIIDSICNDTINVLIKELEVTI